MFRRSRQQLGDPVDGVILSAGCTFPKATDEVELLIPSVASVRKSESGGVIAVISPTTSFRIADATDRQSQFSDAFDAIISKVDAHGIDAAFLTRNDGDLWVSVSLASASGQAGIVFTPAMVAALAMRGGYIDVDALA
ncbi:hypothetical protein IT072_19820 [Leifsonia sp. ZF2019]|uniref:hypothetical protein n=1 Tax=Leifsonia sp. ZF2019 TaxID=2781978 RepID=UPI001CC18A5E|nr:hypothetical protein [Leifsonia sp. ZF2019]UAJ79406.1 hypothetical protein IT072_19820 [Leifsonia sp. ZF2019]